MTEPFATVDDYRGLARAILDRITELNISLETAESLAGIQSGYMAKITADPPLRRASPYTLLLVLQALSLKLTLTHDPQMAERMKHRYEPRKTKRSLACYEKQASPKQASILTPDFLRTRARRGGLSRAARLSRLDGLILPERRPGRVGVAVRKICLVKPCKPRPAPNPSSCACFLPDLIGLCSA